MLLISLEKVSCRVKNFAPPPPRELISSGSIDRPPNGTVSQSINSIVSLFLRQPGWLADTTSLLSVDDVGALPARAPLLRQPPLDKTIPRIAAGRTLGP